jgi:hypothetical protein
MMYLTKGQTVYLYLNPAAGMPEADGSGFRTISQGAAATVIDFSTPEYPGQYCVQVSMQGSTAGSFLVSHEEIKDWPAMSQIERDMQYAVAQLQAVETSTISKNPAYVYVDDLGPGLAELLRTSREHGTNTPFREAWRHLVER